MLGQEAAVFAEGDEDDTVEETLGPLDRRGQVVVSLLVKFEDEIGTALGVGLVQLVADGALTLGRVLEQTLGDRGAVAWPFEQAE
ncbi:MAG: hypothetical protein AAF656_05125 [Planctomycetota bacterium]